MIRFVIAAILVFSFFLPTFADYDRGDYSTAGEATDEKALMAPASLERALSVPSQALAQDYLAGSYMLFLIEPAAVNQNHVVLSVVDGKRVTINYSNARDYLAGYKARLTTYGKAIEQRGFHQIGGTYETYTTRECEKLLPFEGTTFIDQDGFELEVTTGAVKHRAIVVESALAVEHGLNPKTTFLGDISQATIELKHGASNCVVTLKRGNYSAALKKWKQGADQGDAKAQYNLGLMYSKGQGVPRDYAKAIKWYRKAAEQGDAGAQDNLGTMYRKGQGVPQDYVMAHMWFDLASSTLVGDRRIKAMKNRDALEKRVTPQQIAEAQRLAYEWRIKLIK